MYVVYTYMYMYLHVCMHSSARKFADIGHTVQLQFSSPSLHLTSGWAHLVTCHALPGPGVLEGLRGVAKTGTGCVLVVEMSSQGALTTPEYMKGISTALVLG